MNLGMPEILLILAVALLFFGPSRLPGLGKSIGEAIRGLKKGMSETSEDIVAESRKEEPSEKLGNSSQAHTSYHSEKAEEKDNEKKKV
jgi:sec-independent protein translocase protein TatA